MKTGRWVAAMVAATVIAYSTSLAGPYIYDDLPALRNNPSFTPGASFLAALTPPKENPLTGRPVVSLSFALNYALSDALGVDRESPAVTIGFHLVNVVLHIICGLLLFGCIHRSFRPDTRIGRDAVAGMATLIWLVHPLNTEAVDYLTQRTEIMVSLFCLATLYCAIRSRETSATTRWQIAAIACCALGMWSKEIMVAALFIVLLHHRVFAADSWRTVFASRGSRRFYLALFACEAIVFVTVVSGSRGNSVGFGHMTWYQYSWTQAWAVGRYIRLLFWPRGFVFDYGNQPITGLRPVPGLLLIAAIAVTTAIAWRSDRWRWGAFLGACFFLLLAPSSSVVPIWTEVGAERRIYLASATIVIPLVVGAAARWPSLFAGRRLILTNVAIAALLGFGSMVRGHAYQSAESLYRDQVETAPEVGRGYVGLAHAIIPGGANRYAEAVDVLEAGVAIDPSFIALRTLGVVELMRGHWASAARALERARPINPGDLATTVSLARAYVMLGDADKALPLARETRGADVNLMWSLAFLLVDHDRGAEALSILEGVAATSVSASRRALLGVAYAQAGNREQAIETIRAAISTAGDTASVYELSGWAMARLRQPAQARLLLRRALALDSTLVLPRKLLGQMDRTGR